MVVCAVILPVAASAAVIPTEYAPCVVPEPPPVPSPPPEPPPLPPHPAVPIHTISSNEPSIRNHIRRFERTPKRNTKESTGIAAPHWNGLDSGTKAPLVAPVVETVSVLVTAALSVIFTTAGLSEHPGISLAPAMEVLTEHVRFTLPVKPYIGDT